LQDGLDLIHEEVRRRNKIEFLLFKTAKYPSVVGAKMK
jgi:hypothetical protein